MTAKIQVKVGREGKKEATKMAYKIDISKTKKGKVEQKGGKKWHLGKTRG